MRKWMTEHRQIVECLVIIICLLWAFFWGTQKQGFYIDEYYTYTLSNGTGLGISIETGKWNDTAGYMEQLVSSGDENFQFSQTYVNNENDVHPFLYYFIIHFVSSVFSGCFSKWIGIGINILIFLCCLKLVGAIGDRLNGENTDRTILMQLVYGLSPSTMSGIVFIRMYFLLSLFAMIYIYLHICDLKRDKLSVQKFLIPLFFTGFLGFLTQYYFVIYMFCVTFCYCFYLLIIQKRFKDTIIYGMTALMSLIMTYFIWPVSVFHIFKGYRGKGAAEDLVNIGNTGYRFGFFIDLVNKNVFGGILMLYVLLLIAALVVILKKRMGIRSMSAASKAEVLMVISNVCYFFVIAKIALLAKEASNRYEFPIYGIILITAVYGVFTAADALKNLKNSNMAKLGSVLAAILLLALIIPGYFMNQVLYLYPEEAALREYSIEHAKEPVVVFQRDDGMYDTRIGEFINYKQIYFTSCDDNLELQDEKIENADHLIVYVDKKADANQCFERIYKVNSDIKKSKLMFQCNLAFDVYYLD